MDSVFIHFLTISSLLIKAAAPGTGTTKSASLALKDGLLTLTRFVQLYQINARLTVMTDTALPVTRAMT